EAEAILIASMVLGACTFFLDDPLINRSPVRSCDLPVDRNYEQGCPTLFWFLVTDFRRGIF
ncbi:MAG: hypothetical protein KAJ96_02810, partial [Candidatus Thorarchaeota archaeon]|nr:hypothetical protein [Candidatus Thorarchaeota archaeon]